MNGFSINGKTIKVLSILWCFTLFIINKKVSNIQPGMINNLGGGDYSLDLDDESGIIQVL